MVKVEQNKHIVIIVLVYIATWWMLLINYSGVYWDGWTLVGLEQENILNMFDMAGSIWAGYFHSIILSFDSHIFIYRLICFISYLIVGITVYLLLSKIKGINSQTALIISLLTITFPLNLARISIINIPSGFCLALFFIASYMMVYSSQKKLYWVGIIAALLFFISFEVNSLLVYYIIPIVYLFILEKDVWLKVGSRDTLVGVLKYIFSNIHFMVLPLVYFWIKSSYFKPYGPYENYNALSINLQTFYNIPHAFLNSFYYRLYDLKSYINEVSFMIALVMYFVLLKYKIQKNRLYHVLLILGVLMLFIGVFPYYVVGKTGVLEWQDRFQILVPLGAAIILYSAAMLFLREKIGILVLSVVIGLSIYNNNIVMGDFLIDGIKQDAIMLSLDAMPEVKNATDGVIMFEDMATGDNAINRSYRFYEWNGMMEKVFFEQSRFGISAMDEPRFGGWLKYKSYPTYSFSDYNGGDSISGIVTIKRIGSPISTLKGLKLTIEKWINPKNYNSEILNFYSLSWQDYK